MLQQLASLNSESKATIFQILTHLNKILDREGLDALTNGQYNGSLARPTIFEIAAATNRLRVDGIVLDVSVLHVVVTNDNFLSFVYFSSGENFNSNTILQYSVKR